MDPDRINDPKRLDGAAVPLGAARLENWGIAFDLYSQDNGCAVTDIIPSPEEYVLGVLYEVPRELVIAQPPVRSKMDTIEGAHYDGRGNYQRSVVTVRSNGADVDAISYVGTVAGRARFLRKRTEERRVSGEYFQYLETGAQRFGFPESYHNYLRLKAGILS